MNDLTWTRRTSFDPVLRRVRTLAACTPTAVRVTVDDTVIETEARPVAVGNTRTYASGMMITPASGVHDGPLDVCVVGPVSRPRVPAHVPLGVQRAPTSTHPEVRTVCGASTSSSKRSITPRRSISGLSGDALNTAPRAGFEPGRRRAVGRGAGTNSRRRLDGERAFHPLGAMPGDAAVEGVLPGLQVDLLRLRPAATVGLQLEARAGAVEHEVAQTLLDVVSLIVAIPVFAVGVLRLE